MMITVQLQDDWRSSVCVLLLVFIVKRNIRGQEELHITAYTHTHTHKCAHLPSSTQELVLTQHTYSAVTYSCISEHGLLPHSGEHHGRRCTNRDLLTMDHTGHAFTALKLTFTSNKISVFINMPN